MGETRVKKSKGVLKRAQAAVATLPSPVVQQPVTRPIKSISNATSSSTSVNSAFQSSSESISQPEDLDFFTADPRYIEIRTTEKKGVAVFAARKIPQGTLIHAETPLIRLTQSEEDADNANGNVEDDSHLIANFESLSTSNQKRYLSLHDCERTGFSQIKSIYFSNCYNLSGTNKPSPSSPGGSCIAYNGSRFNHSCIPNVQFSFNETQNLMLYYTIKPISRGQELVTNYDSVYALRHKRQAKNQMYYGFECDCEACAPHTEFWAKSDERRKSMIILKTELASYEQQWKKTGTLSIGQDPIAALRNLEAVMTKESLLGIHLANVYRDWAVWAERLEDESGLKMATTKELDLCVKITGAYSARVKSLRSKLGE